MCLPKLLFEGVQQNVKQLHRQCVGFNGMRQRDENGVLSRGIVKMPEFCIIIG